MLFVSLFTCYFLRLCDDSHRIDSRSCLDGASHSTSNSNNHADDCDDPILMEQYNIDDYRYFHHFDTLDWFDNIDQYNNIHSVHHIHQLDDLDKYKLNDVDDNKK